VTTASLPGAGSIGLGARLRTEATVERVTAVALLATLVASLVLLRPIRIAEAMLSSSLLSLTGIGADRVGTSVLVETEGTRAGFTIASGCSTALLAAPFLVVGALAVATGRIRPRRLLATLAVAVVGVIAVNQLRSSIVGASIHWFGFETGYGQSHVLIGTLVSTLGLVVGLAAFVLAMARSRDAEGTGSC